MAVTKSLTKAKKKKTNVKRLKNHLAELCTADSKSLLILKPLLPFLVKKVQDAEKEVGEDGQKAGACTSKVIKTPKTRSETIWQFWLRALLDLKDIQKAWRSFATDTTIKEQFASYDPRVEFLLRTENEQDDEGDEMEGEQSKSAAITKFARLLAKRSLAVEFGLWEEQEGEATVRAFMESKLGFHRQGAAQPSSYRSVAERASKAVSWGVMARTLEVQSKLPAISLILAWNPSQFEHLVGTKGIALSVEVLKDQVFRPLVTWLADCGAKFMEAQGMANRSFESRTITAPSEQFPTQATSSKAPSSIMTTVAIAGTANTQGDALAGGTPREDTSQRSDDSSCTFGDTRFEPSLSCDTRGGGPGSLDLLATVASRDGARVSAEPEIYEEDGGRLLCDQHEGPSVGLSPPNQHIRSTDRDRLLPESVAATFQQQSVTADYRSEPARYQPSHSATSAASHMFSEALPSWNSHDPAHSTMMLRFADSFLSMDDAQDLEALGFD